MFDSSIAFTQFCTKLCLKLSCSSISLKKVTRANISRTTYFYSTDSSIRGKRNMFTKFLTL